MDVVFTPLARRHLRSLRDYIARRSYAVRADAYVRRIVAHCESLGRSPERGVARDDLAPGLRTLGFERRVTILFAITDDQVIIAGVYYGGQDFEARYRD